MKVFIISLRNLILGGIVFLIVLVAGIILLVKDPLHASDPYSPGDQSVPASALTADPPAGAAKPSLNLDVKVEGDTAEVKLLTQNFQFVEDSGDASQAVFGQGHAHLYLNGEPKGMIYQPEFLLKKLPKGEHELRVELNYSNHLPYKVEAVKRIVVQ
ncbi:MULTISPECIES: hypothetical protein [Bacillales]|jgi:hypothetical protein|uniref:Cupredoxin-1 domain-containing protein n=1 Tax=Brevibacillus aydinogluensis TaxID=927786 RepID=A0AA48M9J9_9BACL|nr:MULTISPECIES: hypothetical protein [Bacillales]REK62170.1 MAG: hypothetical protein DF221_12745 [Brevibacillus sp.]MBR8658491.1 hypothetical protein [Brevibacillus sp. NL20B1]MDT3415439.1 hypothetical protein [Brevibacillus aydinogluensis]NNV02085.1 hypothetical protein [Brevibacillus sp. MCWH]UFJ60520.1 hypothetical protein IRT44_14720 [Anoxybacillus sediminis]